MVGTRVGGIPEVVAHRQTGLLVDSENPQALAQAMAFLLDHPEVAAQMGEAARCRVLRDFAWEGYVNAYDTLYSKLLKQQPMLTAS